MIDTFLMDSFLKFVGKRSDHLQVFKFWPSCAPGKGVCGGVIFWLHLTTASAQCLRLSESFSLCLPIECGGYSIVQAAI